MKHTDNSSFLLFSVFYCAKWACAEKATMQSKIVSNQTDIVYSSPSFITGVRCLKLKTTLGQVFFSSLVKVINCCQQQSD